MYAGLRIKSYSQKDLWFNTWPKKQNPSLRQRGLLFLPLGCMYVASNEKSASDQSQNAQIQVILRMCKVSSVPFSTEVV